MSLSCQSSRPLPPPPPPFPLGAPNLPSPLPPLSEESGPGVSPKPKRGRRPSPSRLGPLSKPPLAEALPSELPKELAGNSMPFVEYAPVGACCKSDCGCDGGGGAFAEAAGMLCGGGGTIPGAGGGDTVFAMAAGMLFAVNTKLLPSPSAGMLAALGGGGCAGGAPLDFVARCVCVTVVGIPAFAELSAWGMGGADIPMPGIIPGIAIPPIMPGIMPPMPPMLPIIICMLAIICCI
mmetsp:Transcript_40563/g.72976  ORF Transcript_40563/g.72976 Transcript_40563/m.72976 type:complete len:236 (+) Transcript_40563:641-1348(+)